MPSIVLADDFPSAPKGTVLTTDATGNYVAASGFWISAAGTAKLPDLFIAPVAQNPNFWTANADGTVTQVTAATFGDVKVNWFRSQTRAQAVATKIAQTIREFRSGAL